MRRERMKERKIEDEKEWSGRERWKGKKYKTKGGESERGERERKKGGERERRREKEEIGRGEGGKR